MKFTVVCAAILKRDAEELDLEPIVVHVEASCVQEAESEAATQIGIQVRKQLRFLAVFEGHLFDLKDPL